MRRGAADERHRLDVELAPIEVFAPAPRDGVARRIDRAAVACFAECHAEPLALANGVRGGPAVLAHLAAVGVDQWTCQRLPTGAVAQRLAVIAARHEADFLALRLLGGGET